METESIKIIGIFEKALKEHYWNRPGEDRSDLAPVLFLFDIVDRQRRAKIDEKDALYEAGVEFNRYVLDITGRRHNDSVTEANDLFMAGRTAAKALYPMPEEEMEKAKLNVLNGLKEKYPEGK